MREQSLERRLKKFWQVYNVLSRGDFIRRTGLKDLDKERSAFTDGKLVYKFNFSQSEVDALKAIKGIENVQQLVEYDGFVLVTELIEAKPIELDAEPSRKHLEQLLATLLALRNKSVGFGDIHPGNLLYSQKNGFFPIDLYYLGLPQKPDIDVPRLASCISYDRCPKFLETYLTLLDIFHDLNPRAAKDFFKDYMSSSKHGILGFGYFKASPKEFKKIQLVLKKHCLFDKDAKSCSYTTSGHFGLTR